MSNYTFALDAKTTQIIHGTSPYFVDPDAVAVNGDRNYDKGNFIYYGLQFRGKIFSGIDGLNQQIKNLQFPQIDPNTTTPNQLLAKLKSDYGLDGVILPFNPRISENDRKNVGDDDGDLPIKINPPDNGYTIDWFYRSTNQSYLLLEADRNRTFCELARLGWNPYLRISGAIALVTEYGIPNYKIYAFPKHDFLIYNAIKSTVCSARPSIINSFAYNGRDYTGDWKKITWGDYNQYSIDSGFVNTKTTNGFPTTGFDHARFTITLSGVPFDLSTISGTNTSNGVTMTINPIDGNDIENNLINTGLQIKLTGNATAVHPTFSIKSNQNEIYSFTINKWFSPSTLSASPYSQKKQACQENYVIPSIEDFTNSDQSIITTGVCKTETISNNCLAISTNHYHRAVGTSLFAEWGDVTNEQNQYYHAYPGNNFPKGNVYWTSEEKNNDNQYSIGPSVGAIEWQPKNAWINFICVLK